MTGIPNDNRKAFEEARDLLVDANHSAFIPHAFVPSDAPWNEAMRISINHLTNPSPIRSVFFDGVALLPGWEQSEGARLEKAVADACGITVKTVEEWLEEARVRDLRSECHKLFDRTWKTKDERKDCYVRLSRKLGITLGECHFSTMSAELLERALEILKEDAR